MKKTILFVMIIGVLTLMTACSKTGDTITESTTDNFQENATHNDVGDNAEGNTRIEKDLSSGVIMDAEVSVPKGINYGSMPVYSVSMLEVPVEQFYQLFMKNKKIEQENEQSTEEKIGNGMFKYYVAEDGSNLTYNGGVFLYYSSAAYSNINISLEDDEKKEETFKKDFGFENREESAEKIKKILRSLGIETYAEYECYSLDYQWLQEKNDAREQDIPDEKRADNSGIETVWNEDLNAYFFKFVAAIDNMPVTNEVREVKDFVIPATDIEVVYTKNGIEQITISDCFKMNEEKYQTPIKNVDEIISRLDEKYNSIILDGKYTVEKIQLEYIPLETTEANSYELIPAWRFYVGHEMNIQNKDDSSKTELYKMPTQVLFNAIDGTEIQTGVGQ